jgi:GNAT superfamily N-acetyltransferase
VRHTRAADFDAVIELCKKIYPSSPAWTKAQLASHLEVFPEGQLVAVTERGRVVGMASSLIIKWDDYEPHAAWRDFTAMGTFTNHDPVNGRTLYGAEVMVDPDWQGQGVGKQLYAEREELALRLRLLRIRAGARLRGYGQVAEQMGPEQYVAQVVRGELRDPTLTFQLRRGFRVLDVVGGYLKADPESRGYAALIEWLNPAIATPKDYASQPERYRPRSPVAKAS